MSYWIWMQYDDGKMDEIPEKRNMYIIFKAREGMKRGRLWGSCVPFIAEVEWNLWTWRRIIRSYLNQNEMKEQSSYVSTEAGFWEMTFGTVLTCIFAWTVALKSAMFSMKVACLKLITLQMRWWSYKNKYNDQ